MQNSTKNCERGFTLIELLIAMVIALVVIASISSAFIMQRKTYNVQEQITEMIQGARAALDMISREVKMAGYNPTGSMQTADPTASNFVGIPYDTDQIEIIADLNGDGDTTSDSHENIIYIYDATYHQIDRNTGSGDQPFVENIEAFTFTYLDADGGTTTTTADIRQVEIIVTARTAKPDPDYTPNSGYRTYTLTSYITPPNLDF